jgi:hypothetical protein
MKGLDEFGAAVRRDQLGHRLADQGQPIVVIVLVGPTRHRQAVILILDEAPEQVVQRPQRIDLQVRQRIAGTAAPVLEAPGVQGLHQHPFLFPVRPDQLEEAGAREAMLQDLAAVRQRFLS